MEKILVIFQDIIRCNPVTWTQNVFYSFSQLLGKIFLNISLNCECKCHNCLLANTSMTKNDSWWTSMDGFECDGLHDEKWLRSCEEFDSFKWLISFVQQAIYN